MRNRIIASLALRAIGMSCKTNPYNEATPSWHKASFLSSTKKTRAKLA